MKKGFKIADIDPRIGERDNCFTISDKARCIAGILDTLRFIAHHGVGEQETVVGNEFTVSLRLQVDIRRAAETDDVADTVSYADVHTAVKAEMDIPSKLLEHVCGRIINRLFRDFPQIEEITLKLAKRNPPMGADIEAAGVEICQRRGE